MCLTLGGLIVVKKGDQQKVLVPSYLRQKVLKTFHDQPSAGHMGMQRTLKLMEWQFHLHGI